MPKIIQTAIFKFIALNIYKNAYFIQFRTGLYKDSKVKHLYMFKAFKFALKLDINIKIKYNDYVNYT